MFFFFFFSSRRRHTRFKCDWSSDVCSSDLSVSKSRGENAARDFETEYGREPSFVALEGYDAILVLEAAARAAGSADPAAVCHALRHTEVLGTRGTIAFSTEPAGVVHQQWKWAPTCVVAFRAGRQRFSSSELLWDTELSSRRKPRSG